MDLVNKTIVNTHRGKVIAANNWTIFLFAVRYSALNMNWRIIDQYWRSFDLYKRNIPRIFAAEFLINFFEYNNK